MKMNTSFFAYLLICMFFQLPTSWAQSGKLQEKSAFIIKKYTENGKDRTPANIGEYLYLGERDDVPALVFFAFRTSEEAFLGGIKDLSPQVKAQLTDPQQTCDINTLILYKINGKDYNTPISIKKEKTAYGMITKVNLQRGTNKEHFECFVSTTTSEAYFKKPIDVKNAQQRSYKKACVWADNTNPKAMEVMPLDYIDFEVEATAYINAQKEIQIVAKDSDGEQKSWYRPVSEGVKIDTTYLGKRLVGEACAVVDNEKVKMRYLVITDKGIYLIGEGIMEGYE